MRPFVLPTRVSRLYPIFALFFLLSSTVFVYAWQATQIELTNLSDSYAKRQEQLETQVAVLTRARDQDTATLQVQKEQIITTQAKLSELEVKTKEQTDALAVSEAKLKEAEAQLTKQKDQLASNATELQQLRTRPPLFSFANTSSLQNVEAKEAAIKALITEAYSYAQDIYSSPYLLNQIKITFVDEFTIKGSSGEIIIENGPKGISIDIRLKDFDSTRAEDVSTVIHEMIHGFHGVAVAEASAIEEGMTVAATEAVMTRMIADGKLPKFSRTYLSLGAKEYTRYNSILTVHADNQEFYSDQYVSQVYQLIGTAWYNLYKEKPTVFKELNEAYYAKVQKGQSADTKTILNALKTVMPSYNGEPISTYLDANKAFNPE